MLDTMKKIALTGLGLAFVTKDKVEEVAREIIDKGKLSEQEGRELVEELKTKSQQASEDLKKELDSMVEKTVQKLNLASRSDLERLEKQIEELTAALKETKAGG